MIKSSTLTTTLGLLGLAAQTIALPSHPSRNYPVASRGEDNPNISATTVNLMPLGASIVEITCWRAHLWRKLRDAGVENIDFVGSNSGPRTCAVGGGQTVAFDKNHEGHSGAKVTDYAKNGNVATWLNNAKPDVIIMHVGTNDASAKVSCTDLIKAYDTLLSQMRVWNPNMSLVLSKLIPIDPNLFGQEVADRIVQYNTAMEDWAKKNNQQNSPITLVDMYSGFDYKTMTREGEHPNEAGDKFIAEHLFEPVKHALAASSKQKLYG